MIKLLFSIMDSPLDNKYDFIKIYNDNFIKDFLQLLKSNKVPLNTLKNRILHEERNNFKYNKMFSDYYENDINLYEELRNEWICVEKIFEDAGIETIFIKSVDHFPYKSSNLDILIKEDKRDLAEFLLMYIGYIQLHNVEEPYKTLFRRFEKGKSVSAIHLHNKVAWINPFHDEKLLWKRYVRSGTDESVDVPSPEDSVLILTAHWFYEDKELKMSDIRNLSICLNNEGFDWDYMEKVAEKFGWSDGYNMGLLVYSHIETTVFGNGKIPEDLKIKMQQNLPRWLRYYLYKHIYRDPITMPYRIPKVLGKFLHLKKSYKDETINIYKKFKDIFLVAYSSLVVILFERFNINIRKQPGMLISFSGVDGSGKTTLAWSLSEILNFCELKNRYVWSRVGSASFLKPISFIYKKFIIDNNNKQRFKNKHEQSKNDKSFYQHSKVLRIIHLSLLIIEMILVYTFKVKLPLMLKRIVVCDRYIYDTFVDIMAKFNMNIREINGSVFVKIINHVSPKPDVAYVIQVPIENIYLRREFSEDEKELISKQQLLYNNIASDYNLKEIIINGTEAVEDIKNKILCEVLSSYYAKWE